MTGAREWLTEALAGHRRKYVPYSAPWGDGSQFVGCTCGWELVWPKPTQHVPAPSPVETFEHHRVAALLPVVERIAAEKAAEELEDEAAYDDGAPDQQYARRNFAARLRQRAANLRFDAAVLAPDGQP